jgi:hypothetical protein
MPENTIVPVGKTMTYTVKQVAEISGISVLGAVGCVLVVLLATICARIGPVNAV